MHYGKLTHKKKHVGTHQVLRNFRVSVLLIVHLTHTFTRTPLAPTKFGEISFESGLDFHFKHEPKPKQLEQKVVPAYTIPIKNVRASRVWYWTCFLSPFGYKCNFRHPTQGSHIQTIQITALIHICNSFRSQLSFFVCFEAMFCGRPKWNQATKTISVNSRS